MAPTAANQLARRHACPPHVSENVSDGAFARLDAEVTVDGPQRGPDAGTRHTAG